MDPVKNMLGNNKFKEGQYVIITQGKDRRTFEGFNSMNEVYNWVAKQWEGEPNPPKITAAYVKAFFEESADRGIWSYDAYSLYQYKNGRLRKIYSPW